MRCVSSSNDVMDILADGFGKSGVILLEQQLGPRFFDLSTGLAGELFQKCMNYNLKLALVIADRSQYSKRLQELAHEHDTHPSIRFFADQRAATNWLGGDS